MNTQDIKVAADTLARAPSELQWGFILLLGIGLGIGLVFMSCKYTELEGKHGDLDKRLSVAEGNLERNIKLIDANRKIALDSKSSVVDGALAASDDKKVLALPEETRHMLAEAMAEADYEETLSLLLNTNDSDAHFQFHEAVRDNPGFLKERFKKALEDGEASQDGLRSVIYKGAKLADENDLDLMYLEKAVLLRGGSDD